MTLPVAAVDLGASSVRVAVVDLAADRPQVEIVHRVHHGPLRRSDGSLRWNLDLIVDAVARGLDEARARWHLASIGIDAWGVDYGLLGDDGRLIDEPYSYRDRRTEGWRTVADRLGPYRLYELTGLQLVPFNTVFQLAVHKRGDFERATRLLTISELVAHHLVDDVATIERTPAGTTGLVELATGTWSAALLDDLGVPRRLLPPIEAAPRPLGRYRDVPVLLVAGHDTACAFVAAPSAGPGTVVISSGTWMLVGTHVERPVTGEAAFRANLSNEPAFPHGYRLLRNVVGLWILERCREAWGLSLREVLARADTDPEGPSFDATDGRFLASDAMPTTVATAAGLPDPGDVGRVAGCVLRSLAATTRDVIADLTAATGRTFDEVVVVGGGVANEPLNRLIGELTGLPVRLGPAEATALGNAVVQGLGLGRFSGMEEARRWIG